MIISTDIIVASTCFPEVAQNTHYIIIRYYSEYYKDCV